MMSIKDWREKIKSGYVIVVIILLISLGWGLTKLYALEQGRTPITIENVGQ